MRLRNWLDTLRSAVLVAVLVIAQSAVLTHLDTDDAHPGSDDCVLCVGLSTLGAAAVAGAPAALPARTFELLPPHQPTFTTAARALARSARGPPRNT